MNETKITLHNKIAYVCSPFRGDVKRNKEYARELTKDVIKMGMSPITPHLYLTEALDDNIPKERKQGLEVGLALLDCCHYIYVGDKYGISEGMKAEIEKAKELDISILKESFLMKLTNAVSKAYSIINLYLMQAIKLVDEKNKEKEK